MREIDVQQIEDTLYALCRSACCEIGDDVLSLLEEGLRRERSPFGREVLRHKDDPKAVREIGTEWAVAQSRELVEAGVPVLHYYPMGKADNIIKIAKAIF